VIPPAVAKPLNALIDLLGEKALVALLQRLLEGSRDAQLKANHEAGRRVFVRKGKR
jgi:hypothetical protein